MAVYEYKCACGKVTEKFSTMAEMKDAIKCECGKKAKRVFSVATVVAYYPLGHPRVGRGRRVR